MDADEAVRPCRACDRSVVEGEPDPCLGLIPGVSHACCGHGDVRLAYVVIGGEPDEPAAAWLPDARRWRARRPAYFEARAPGRAVESQVVADDPFTYSGARFTVDGHTIEVTDVEFGMTLTPVIDPVDVRKMGGCPDCGVIPMSGAAHLCEHGVIPERKIEFSMTIEDPDLYARFTEWFA
jgi:hypothetical protein